VTIGRQQKLVVAGQAPLGGSRCSRQRIALRWASDALPFPFRRKPSCRQELDLLNMGRMMLADGAPASNAAYAVGYESVPQFTREYRRFFVLHITE
jgi:AraC-like DNA-binding protein